jgi:hypothetical protein
MLNHHPHQKDVKKAKELAELVCTTFDTVGGSCLEELIEEAVLEALTELRDELEINFSEEK